jgi:hypothetical protein
MKKGEKKCESMEHWNKGKGTENTDNMVTKGLQGTYVQMSEEGLITHLLQTDIFICEVKKFRRKNHGQITIKIQNCSKSTKLQKE